MEEKQYKRYLEIAKRITSNDERHADLLHDVLIQLQSNAKFTGLSETEKVYFFTRAATNQYKSNNSHFQRTYRRFSFDELGTYEKIEIEYVETPSIEWINETLKIEEVLNPDRWYDIGLFRIYMELKKIDAVHKKTRIPKYSIRKTINEMKIWLQEEWARQMGN